MKSIIDGLLYDTEKAECVGTYPDTCDIYRTKNNRIFINTASGEFIVDEKEVKDIIGKYLPNIYIALFGEVEEA